MNFLKLVTSQHYLYLKGLIVLLVDERWKNVYALGNNLKKRIDAICNVKIRVHEKHQTFGFRLVYMCANGR